MRHYERRLPHWDLVDQPLFVTFRLHGSLPAQRVFTPEGLALSGKAFVTMDRLLDPGANGPLHLCRREIAELVAGALCVCCDAQSCSSSGYTEGCGEPMVGAVEGIDCLRANERIGGRGEAFWQDESYDHLVRSAVEFQRIRAYIEENPATAGLAVEAQEYLRSSAASRLKGGCHIF